ncbi:MAG: hypothetical protein U0X20_11340 [Caldilineaceae bacterium]
MRPARALHLRLHAGTKEFPVPDNCRLTYSRPRRLYVHLYAWPYTRLPSGFAGKAIAGRLNAPNCPSSGIGGWRVAFEDRRQNTPILGTRAHRRRMRAVLMMELFLA